MGGPIIVVDADPKECRELCELLKKEQCPSIGLNSLGRLQEELSRADCRAVVLDLDTVVIDNRFIRNLRRQYPRLPIMALSSRSFHPELEEAMSTHICACLAKPPDLEELIYCIKTLCGDPGHSADNRR